MKAKLGFDVDPGSKAPVGLTEKPGNKIISNALKLRREDYENVEANSYLFDLAGTLCQC